MPQHSDTFDTDTVAPAASRPRAVAESTFAHDTAEESTRRLSEAVEQWEKAVDQWAADVFAGRLPFDPEDEAGLQMQLQALRRDAGTLLMQVRHGSFGSAGDQEKVGAILERLERAAGEWVSPQRSVGPGPRTVPAASAEAEIRATIQGMTRPR